MNTMNGNPHYAPHLADYAETNDGRAVAEATLALAHEQRTRNLIAAHRLLFEQGLGHYVEAEEQIVARLGLNGDRP